MIYCVAQQKLSRADGVLNSIHIIVEVSGKRVCRLMKYYCIHIFFMFEIIESLNTLNWIAGIQLNCFLFLNRLEVLQLLYIEGKIVSSKRMFGIQFDIDMGYQLSINLFLHVLIKLYLLVFSFVCSHIEIQFLNI